MGDGWCIMVEGGEVVVSALAIEKPGTSRGDDKIVHQAYVESSTLDFHLSSHH